MKKQLLFSTQFIIRIFCIAVVVDTGVSSAQLLHGKDYSFSDLQHTVLSMLRANVLLFAAVSILLLIIVLLAGRGREKTFWLLMIIGLPAISLAYINFDSLFIKYTNQTGAMAAIGTFALMVSLASQYQFFHKYEFAKGLDIEIK